MLALYLGARLLYREKSMLNAIGAAALALMIVNPQVLFGASFQLTFLCAWLVAASSYLFWSAQRSRSCEARATLIRSPTISFYLRKSCSTAWICA
jgi:predicted membrane metal-binding protein